MAPEVLAERLQLAAAIALFMIGAVMAWASANAVKRVAGIAVAQMAALLALAVLKAPASMLIALVALAFATLLVGAALLVRLQEAYGGVHAPDFDAADEQSEPAEPSA